MSEASSPAPAGEKGVRAQSKVEEIINAVTHGLGAFVSVAAITILIVLASQERDAWAIVAVSIYGASLFLLYLASMLYHGVDHPRAKYLLNQFDHCAIYLLIAGTYTPFLLVNMRSTTGWVVFAILWTLALTGIYFKLKSPGKRHKVHLVNYIVMGWMGLIVAPQLMMSLPPVALDLIIAGGIVYTVGIIFYLLDRVPYAHSIWHLFVLGGSTCHYIAVYYGVLLTDAS
ncbi:PAQR family membrane homeostasis protein TrhA [Allohahella marinimesophila]|uniref:Hemolysin III family protein n=1 Tax=Allohahella marinimesophila TaxID=1054972 RepID=A0ABP7PZQ0_9GAMM